MPRKLLLNWCWGVGILLLVLLAFVPVEAHHLVMTLYFGGYTHCRTWPQRNCNIHSSDNVFAKQLFLRSVNMTMRQKFFLSNDFQKVFPELKSYHFSDGTVYKGSSEVIFLDAEVKICHEKLQKEKKKKV